LDAHNRHGDISEHLVTSLDKKQGKTGAGLSISGGVSIVGRGLNCLAILQPYLLACLQGARELCGVLLVLSGGLL
jgi:hypothetical protein